MAEDQKLGVKDTKPVFTTSHDECILHKYNSNKAFRGDQKLSQEALCDSIAHKLQMEPVRVYYRLQRLLRLHSSSNDPIANNSDNNHSETHSSTTSTSSIQSTQTSNSDAGSSPLAPRTANRYTENEDMAIYAAYLSNSAESKRKRALDQVRKLFFVSIICVHNRIFLI